jgi:hypothetical protein
MIRCVVFLLINNLELYFSKEEWADDLWIGNYIDRTTGEPLVFLNYGQTTL